MLINNNPQYLIKGNIMCQGVVKDIQKAAFTGGASLITDKRSERKKVREGEAEVGRVKEAARKKGIKQEQTRAKQISRFNTNVAAGGAKRASNVGR
jgi:hypothetical protein